MSKAAQTLSAKDFRDPLLKVLATHTKFDSGRTVKAENIYDHVCKLMGVNPEDFGSTGGILWTQKWIQWAFQSLKDEGLGVKHSRGTWGLTPNGVDKARSMMISNQPDATSTPCDEVLNMDDLVTIIAAIPVEANPIKDGTYHSDPYICEVALSNHKCMGFFTNQSPICVTCPARVLCQYSAQERWISLAADLDAADTAALKLTPPHDSGDKASGNLDIYQIPANATIIDQTNAVTTMCNHCTGMISSGDPSVWVRFQNNQNERKSLVFHPKCCARYRVSSP